MAIVSLEKNSDGESRFTGSSNIRDFEFIDKLGEGTFGEVYKARSKKTNTIVALKKILMHNEKDGFPITAIREIKILKILSHPNVLQLKEMAIERGKGEGRKKPSMYMVTPYMEHDLSGLLENSDALFTEPQIKCYMMQLLEGLRYLHASQILHRDMKAANLLISNGGILQIADFGLARPYDEEPPQPGKGGGKQEESIQLLLSLGGTARPSCFYLCENIQQPSTCGECVFGEMFKGKPILSGRSDLEQLELIFNLVGSPTEDNMPGWSTLPGCEGVKSFAYSRGNLPGSFKALSPLAISLLSELLKLDWRKRINAIDALKHPYFTTPPLPARPGEIPSYQDSHEFDRKKLRNQQKPFPPAPAGAVTNGPSSGGWTGSSSRVPNSGNSRIPGAARGGRSNNAPVGPGNNNRRGPFPPSQNNGLPPRPPVSAHQTWEGPPGRGDRRDDQRRDQFNQNRQNGRFSSNVDSYVPHYGNPNDRAQDASDYNTRNADWRGSNRFDQRRDYHREPRRRSRSPSNRDVSKEASRDASKGP
ncbi:Serine/threonine-protein kinase bur1 [Penicillium taxi]|uniref:Serine/threonine-protein kinase bur1 n=1 Tax=Penicillium taxi TaxID=168475 RepID=UPI0025454F34|nr:Serine/threonine-protein kinase bur1 [Penicillium taxi]KAJ5888884.1 Serine/threonine-protein kinase bur1 [Penicillium taxi]